MSTLLVTHEACIDHDPGIFHPERPDRLRAVLAGLQDIKVERVLAITMVMAQELAVARQRAALQATRGSRRRRTAGFPARVPLHSQQWDGPRNSSFSSGVAALGPAVFDPFPVALLGFGDLLLGFLQQGGLVAGDAQVID